MGFNPYAAGSKTYGSGSSAATTGTVDPMGYITRELNKRRSSYQGGADGESDTRSSLAQQALQRLQQNQPGGLQPSPTQAPMAQPPGQMYSLVKASPSGKLKFNNVASKPDNPAPAQNPGLPLLQRIAQRRLGI